MSFGYSITITFLIWILGLVLVIALFMPNIQSSIDAVNNINQSNTVGYNNLAPEVSDEDNLINYTPLSIFKFLQ
jgi:hypothetical protein